jgi:hypothetical protein
LYVYPRAVNLSARTGGGSASARNICIGVQLMRGAKQALPLLFGKSSGQQRVAEAKTNVLYHNR